MSPPLYHPITPTYPLNRLLNTAIQAGIEVLRIYHTDFEVEFKKDSSPLTTADLMSNRIIMAGLKDTGLPILSEEKMIYDYEERIKWKEYWLVDPLDGTKEFVNKRDEFTVNIALIRDKKPVFGVIYAPVLKTLYFGGEKLGSYKLVLEEEMKITEKVLSKAQKLPLKHDRDPNILTVVGSRSHLSEETIAYVESLKNDFQKVSFVSRGSSLKLCMVAEGSADIYPRLGPTMEWDIAAGHAILTYAGKSLEEYGTGREFEYNKEELVNGWFVARGMKVTE